MKGKYPKTSLTVFVYTVAKYLQLPDLFFDQERFYGSAIINIEV